MSWLFAVSIPGLLMLATFGLERLETRLHRDALRASDVAEFLEQAQPGDVKTLARDGMHEALDCFHRRRMQRIEPSMEAVMEAANNHDFRPRAYRKRRVNPQFQPSRYADRV